MFKKVEAKMDLPKLEELIIEYWDKNNIFNKSIESRGVENSYVFYDGPPFATGTPHYGHIVASTLKDVVPRYWTMKGKRVERKWGWDCHGLPIENIAEKELNIKSKKQIEDEIGIEKFNEFCRSKVLSYVDEWKVVIKRLGRWADMDNAYLTMDINYMESVWWVFKQLWDRGLIYEDYRSMHICPRCETTLSQSEVTEGYKVVKDLSVVAKFELVDEPGTYILAWTTTPWTLIGNAALAVGEKIKYKKLKIKDDSGRDDFVIIAANRIADMIKGEYEEIEEINASDIIGKSYKPLFDYYANDGKLKNKENGWKVVATDFVTTEDGTGVVHIAPAFGEDDMNLGRNKKLPFIQHVGMDGVVKPEATEFAGMHVKPIDDVQKTDVEIIKYLASKNLLFSKEKYEHSYPHCWRCDTPLLNYATSSWFVKVSEIKSKALETAKEINWSPSHIKNGRFGKWLEGAKDWSISRQRFWASVIPIWQCECGEQKIIGSIEELRKVSNLPITKVTLVRHSQSEKNLGEKIYTATKDRWPLTEQGKKDAEKLAKRLDANTDVIIVSPVLRAKQTAEIVNSILNIPIIEEELVSEIEFGEWTDLSKEEREKLESHKNFEKIKSDSEQRYYFKHGIAGESRHDVVKRTETFIKKIVKEYPGRDIIVVGHGGLYPSFSKILHNVSYEEFFKRLSKSRHDTTFEFYLMEDGSYLDLHKDKLDKIAINCSKCHGKMKRVPDVLDTWFDSGSMPYAQMHYPYENQDKFEANFPAEFIAEGADQTRAWFYYLHVLATSIFDKPAFKNVIVNGIVQAEDGKKMSKRLQNYPDPIDVFNKYGADVLRYYLMSSPVVAAGDLNFSEKEMAELQRGVFRMLWNSYYFFVLYAEIDGLNPKTEFKLDSKNILDNWIISELQNLISDTNYHMKKYDLLKAIRGFQGFIDNLSNWYIRRSRKRFWKSENDNDKSSAYETLHYVLVQLAKLMAPFTPFISEEIYGNLTNEESVHLADYPEADKELVNTKLNNQMARARAIVELGLAARAKSGIKVRQPLSTLKYFGEKIDNELEEIIADEVNVKKVMNSTDFAENQVDLETEITEELKIEGLAREIIRNIQSLRKKKDFEVDDRIELSYYSESEMLNKVMQEMGDEIAREVLANDLNKVGTKNDEAEEFVVENEAIFINIAKYVL